MKENGKWKITWIIDKFLDPDNKIGIALKTGVKISDYIDSSMYVGQDKIKGNLLLNTGIDEIWDLVVGDSVNHFDNTNARIGVGNDNTAAAASQTDLLGGSTAYGAMDATYPLSTSQGVVFRASFGSAEALFAWEEFVIKQNTSAICLNRKVASRGTKSSGETWAVSVTITLS